MRQGKYTKRRPSHRPAGLTNRIPAFIRVPFAKFWALSWKKKMVLVGIPALVLVVLTPLATYAYFARDISDPERLMNRNNTGVQLLDKSGKVFYSTGTSKPLTRLPLSDISDDMEAALIASEDKDFYTHNGVSLTSMVAALYANVTGGDLTAYGGSTLTQQLVKNTLLTTDQTFIRKYQELSIAIAVDRTYSKDQILDMYLNSVYYGENAFGIDAAAKRYFGTSAKDLSLAESAMLVGILPAPSAYSPISGDPDLAKRQQTTVLERMVDNGKITQTQMDDALAEELSYADAPASDLGEAPHFSEMVLSELNKKYGENAVVRSGYRVQTGLDLELQKKVEQYVSEQTAINARLGGRNAAVVVIDPKNGEIRALVGSSDYENETFGKVNMAIAARQPGSSFKPVYFSEALAKGVITPATIMEDKAKTYGDYKPNNFDFKFRGDISVRNALSQSLNIPAVDVMQKLGVGTAVNAAERMGITTLEDPNRYGLSLALGAAEAKPLEMTNVYAAFANQGVQYDPTSIKSITDKYGDTVYTYRPNGERVLSTGASFLISDILSDNNARAPTFGSSLNISGRDVAVKTGSTDDNRDAWTIGYTPSVAVGVWVGNNENEVMQSGGSAFAGPIWRRTIQAALGGTSSESFQRPNTVSSISICRGTEDRAINQGSNTFNEFFLAGSTPSGTCNQRDLESERRQREAAEDAARAERERLEDEREAAEEEAERQREQAEEEAENQQPPVIPPTNNGGGNTNPGGRGSGSTQPTQPIEPTN